MFFFAVYHYTFHTRFFLADDFGCLHLAYELSILNLYVIIFLHFLVIIFFPKEAMQASLVETWE